MRKYIIKNCTSYCEFEKEYTCGVETKELFCEDNTDCLLKQIVEKCKGVQEKFYDAVHSRYLSPSKAKFAREILDLLQIEEINE